jgi:hypothetical protein
LASHALLRAPTPFDQPNWLFELKHDGFRGVAIIEGQVDGAAIC